MAFRISNVSALFSQMRANPSLSAASLASWLFSLICCARRLHAQQIPSANRNMNQQELRIGIDLGGTKIEGVVMDAASHIVQRLRWPTPRDSYQAQVHAIAEMVLTLENNADRRRLPVGIGHPGTISPATGLIKNANSVCLNGRPMKQDLEKALQRQLRMANDADCLAVSEAHDGAAAGARSVFAVILGTGVGGGLVVDGKLHHGPNAIAGEWGHNPLPWPRMDWDEIPGPEHWDGQNGSIEAWLSGPGISAAHHRDHGKKMSSQQILAASQAGEAAAERSLQRYEHRLARALASLINVLDPEVVVLAGGLSNIQRLYENVPALWSQWIFSDQVCTRLVQARHGDSSGVRGAAWLWPTDAR